MSAPEAATTAHCPLSGGDRPYPDQRAAQDALGAGRCPLTDLDAAPTHAVVGAGDEGKPIRHNRLGCPQPCGAQWFIAGDGGVSHAGSELIVNWPDLA